MFHVQTSILAGVEFPNVPNTGSVPLVVDMSSNFLTRPVDVSKVSIIEKPDMNNVFCLESTTLVRVYICEDRVLLWLFLDRPCVLAINSCCYIRTGPVCRDFPVNA